MVICVKNKSIKIIVSIICILLALVIGIFIGTKIDASKDWNDKIVSQNQEQSDTSSNDTATKEPQLTMAEIYNPIIDEYEEIHSMSDEQWGGYYCEWLLFDIDNDGVSELIVSKETCEADREHNVYKIKNDEAVFLGKYGGWHTVLYDNNGTLTKTDGAYYDEDGGPGIYYCEYQIVITDDKVEEKKIGMYDFDVDNPPFDDSKRLVFNEIEKDIEL